MENRTMHDALNVRPEGGTDAAKKVGRTRPIQIKFFVDEQELSVIHQRMALMGIKNMSAYLRKISQDGFLYNVEYPGLHEVCSQIESISVNINQIAKRVNSTGTIYAEDMRQIKKGQEEIWQLFKKLLSKLV